MATLTLPINELNSFDLPPVCLITGEKENVSFHKVKFSWYPRWIALLIFVPYGGLLLAIIVALIMTKRAAGSLPFSERGWARWRLAKITLLMALLWMIGALVAGIALLASERTAPGSLIAASAFVVPIVLGLTLVRGRTVTPARITDIEVALKIPSETAATAIAAHLHAGRVVQAMPVAATT